jgi:hypothetical protein
VDKRFGDGDGDDGDESLSFDVNGNYRMSKDDSIFRVDAR